MVFSHQSMWETLMSPDLPDVHARYFAAQNDHDIDAIVACFAPAAAVRDEGRDIVGAGAIRVWKEETRPRYRITAETVRCSVRDDRTIVVVKVSGTFDGVR
jgi:hypothetical protein